MTIADPPLITKSFGQVKVHESPTRYDVHDDENVGSAQVGTFPLSFVEPGGQYVGLVGFPQERLMHVFPSEARMKPAAELQEQMPLLQA